VTTTSTWDWLKMGREALHQVLGFVIGELPVDPPGWSPEFCAEAAAAATCPS
jgi:hypothetical protein